MNKKDKVIINKLRVSFAKREDDRRFIVVYGGNHITVEPRNDFFSQTIECVWPGATLNLLEVERDGDLLRPSYIVLEPDYLLDISSLAECVKPCGAHPANFLYNRLTPVENALPIILGNIANLFLDEWIYSRKPDFVTSLKKAFRQYPIEISACEDLQDGSHDSQFASDCRRHFDNIKLTVTDTFRRHGLNPDKAILEPSYVCEALGIQGRLDYMQTDMRAFIEMKSGKADEFKVRGQILPRDNNLAQMLLYMATLRFNMGMREDTVRPYLLYTRYPKLHSADTDWTMVKHLINMRNQIVRLDYAVQQNNDTEYTRKQLELINPETLNTEHLDGRLWTDYIRRDILNLRAEMDGLDETEKDYFLTLYNFIVKEQYIAKTGGENCYGRTGASALWLSGFEEKKQAGEILFDMKIKENKTELEHDPYIVLSLPKFAPGDALNFRDGDIIMLYRRENEEDTALNQLVVKGSIAYIRDGEIKIDLRMTQRNQSVFPDDGIYAAEHDSMDTGYRNMYLALRNFLSCGKKRRNLILSAREPEFDSSYDKLIEEEEDIFKKISLKALAARDYYLLVGPPGTGKTSCALRTMVRMFVEHKPTKQILLMAYTNRAVDEICHSIMKITPEIDFIRVGGGHSSDELVKKHLLRNVLKECRTRGEVLERMKRCRVYVGTVASLSGRPDLFRLKHFDAAIIDEATQILEPQLLGILTARFADGREAIDKFVMIGDPRQLPAVVLQQPKDSEVDSPLLRKRGITNLKDSLFERLYRHHGFEGKAIDMLCRQGRMHPKVADFPNRAFYFGKLSEVGLEHQMENIQNATAFIPSECDGRGKVNPLEADIVCKLVKRIYELNKENFDPHMTVGVITPFRAQIALIRSKLAALGIPVLEELAVDTVERYQGSERDIIIYSFSVTDEKLLKWLPNISEERGVKIDRKLNVALTRARRRMIVTGVPEILSHNDIYNEMMKSMPNMETVPDEMIKL